MPLKNREKSSLFSIAQKYIFSQIISANVEDMQTEMDKPKALELAKSRLPLGPNRQLYIECEQGRSGQKTIQIYILSEQKVWPIANIRFFEVVIFVFLPQTSA
jgi:hypothetical protein